MRSRNSSARSSRLGFQVADVPRFGMPKSHERPGPGVETSWRICLMSRACAKAEHGLLQVDCSARSVGNWTVYREDDRPLADADHHVLSGIR